MIISNRNYEFIIDCLAPGDDEKLWKLACERFFIDALGSLKKKSNCPIFIEIGSCSRWLSGEEKRFSDSQGLPLPADSEKDKLSFSRLVLPEYDWSLLFYYDEKAKEWCGGEIPRNENYLCFRTALPAKSSNLNFSTGYTVWMNADGVMSKPQLYSFRKVEEEWECIINPFSKKP